MEHDESLGTMALSEGWWQATGEAYQKYHFEGWAILFSYLLKTYNQI